eukprot:4221471-Prymnesium_polylepis.1
MNVGLVTASAATSWSAGSTMVGGRARVVRAGSTGRRTPPRRARRSMKAGPGVVQSRLSAGWSSTVSPTRMGASAIAISPLIVKRRALAASSACGKSTSNASAAN